MKENQKIILALILGFVIGFMLSSSFFNWSQYSRYGGGMMFRNFGPSMADHMFFGPWINMF